MKTPRTDAMTPKYKPTIYEAIGDCAARLHFSWSWGRDGIAEQKWAKDICRAIGVPVRKCPLPHNLKGRPIKFKP